MRSNTIAAWLQLTKLFLRQFLENDLVSPDSDRAHTLAIIGAGVVSLTLFISMFLSATYAMSVLTPGEAAMRTLSDKFFYVSLAMLITALDDRGRAEVELEGFGFRWLRVRQPGDRRLS